MTVIKHSKTKNIKAAIKYVTTGKSHNGINTRVARVSYNGLDDNNAIEQALNTLDRFSKKKYEGHILIQSFAKGELSVYKSMDVAKANEIGMDTAKRLFGDTRQFVVATHCDNGLVHNHIVAVNADMVTGKAISGSETLIPRLRAVSDSVVASKGVYNVIGLKGRKKSLETSAEVHMREKNKYVWKDDLRDRITDALERACDFDELNLELNKNSVELLINGSGNITYRFTDLDDKLRRSRAKKLGEKWDNFEIEKSFKINKEKREKEKLKKKPVRQTYKERESLTNFGNTPSLSFESSLSNRSLLDVEESLFFKKKEDENKLKEDDFELDF